MSLAQQRFLQGFISKCASLGISDETVIASLLKTASDEALKRVEKQYRTAGKLRDEQYDKNKLAGATGTHALEEDGETKAEEYPTQT